MGSELFAMSIDPELSLYMIAGMARDFGWQNLPAEIKWQETVVETIDVGGKEISQEKQVDKSKTAPDGLLIPDAPTTETTIHLQRYLVDKAESEADADTKLVDVKTWVTQRQQDVFRKSAVKFKTDLEIALLHQQIEAKKEQVRTSLEDKELKIELGG